LVECSVRIEECGTWDELVEVIYVCNLFSIPRKEIVINGGVPLRASEWSFFLVEEL